MVATAEPELPQASDAPPPPGFRGFARRQRRWLPALGFAALGIVLFAAYLSQARSLAALSSSAGQALQGWSMLHGNLLLHGWTVSDVSFYTTEVPEYALVEWARGLTGDTVHVAAALTYALVVVLAGALARGRASGRDGLVRALIAIGIMLAPSLHFGTQVLLAGPDHIGTHVPLLLIWLVLDRARPRWWVPAAVAVLLTWAQIADQLVLYEGVAPLIVVCLLRMRRRGRAAGDWRQALAADWYELALTAVAVASALAARLVLTEIRAAGGVVVRKTVAGFATAPGMSAGIWPKIHNVMQVFGASVFGLPLGQVAAFALIHLIGVALVAWAVAGGVRRLYTEPDLIAAVLTVAFALLLAAYMLATKADPNEIVGLLPIGAVLAGRRLAGRLISGGLVPALAVVLACTAGMLMFNAARPPGHSRGNQQAADWLAAHHLDYGLGGYWNANSVTVDSGGRVRVRPVRMFRRELVTTPSESARPWYDAGRHSARFVLLESPASCWNVCLSGPDLRAEFGPPERVYRVGRLRVMVWRQNLLGAVPVLSWCRRTWSWTAKGQPSAALCRSQEF